MSCRSTAVVSMLAWAAPLAVAQCGVEFVNQFWPAGFDEPPRAAIVFDDGEGPQLYVAGYFHQIGPVRTNWIARWNGSTWRPLSWELPLQEGRSSGVYALAAYDEDADGPLPPTLYLAGNYEYGQGFVASWDGREWNNFHVFLGPVYSLLVFDFDGSGSEPSKLVVGGGFWDVLPNGDITGGIAVWDGHQWSTPGGEFDGDVLALCAWDADGDGPEPARLIAAGSFTSIDSTPIRSIARWDGEAWQPLRDGVGGSVSALASFDADGIGPNPPALYAGGYFEEAGGHAIRYLARWDGNDWTSVGGEPSSSVQGLFPRTEGDRPVLYATGYFTSIGGVETGSFARWDGESWSAFSANAPGVTYNLAEYSDPGNTRPSALYAVGSFGTAGDTPASGVARWDGEEWSAVASGQGITGSSYSLATFDADGSGPNPPELYVGGSLDWAGMTAVENLARWDGERWAAVLPGPDNRVVAIESLDSGTDPLLYVAGTFQHVGDLPAQHVACWNGAEWSDLDGGIPGQVFALAVHDDGTGPALYAAGAFQMFEDGDPEVAILAVARWDGAHWRRVGSGFGGGVGLVSALLSWDPDEDGPAPALLVATGNFQYSGSTAVRNIAAWDGTSWQRMGYGLSYAGLALAAYNDGNGSALYVAGDFDMAGVVNANGIARWNGQRWSALGNGTTRAGVTAMRAFDHDGPGPLPPTLYLSNGMSWDGANWSDDNSTAARAFEVFDDGDGPALFAAGGFSHAGGFPAKGIAKLARRGPIGDLNGDLTVDLGDLTRLLSRFGTSGDASYADGDLDGDADVDLRDLARLIAALGSTCL